MMRACSLLRLARLAVRRRRSAEAYRAMQSYIAECTILELLGHGVDVSQCRVLELGAGRGGYSRTLADQAGLFVASDIFKDPVFEEDCSDIRWEKVDVKTRFPFDDGSFDFIHCSSLVEHVPSPADLLEEARRVLGPGGSMLLSFPPFWSLSMVGGHTFKPFHFLGERAAVFITNTLHRSKVRDYAHAYGERGGLFPLTIREVGRLAATAGFQVEALYSRMSRVNTAVWPAPLADLFSWHVCYLLSRDTKRRASSNHGERTGP